jgi:hypothetical protein
MSRKIYPQSENTAKRGLQFQASDIFTDSWQRFTRQKTLAGQPAWALMQWPLFAVWCPLFWSQISSSLRAPFFRSAYKQWIVLATVLSCSVFVPQANEPGAWRGDKKNRVQTVQGQRQSSLSATKSMLWGGWSRRSDQQNHCAIATALHKNMKQDNFHLCRPYCPPSSSLPQSGAPQCGLTKA